MADTGGSNPTPFFRAMHEYHYWIICVMNIVIIPHVLLFADHDETGQCQFSLHVGPTHTDGVILLAIPGFLFFFPRNILNYKKKL